MSILIMVFVVIGLSVLILAHEAGHFFCAKFFNVKVEEFGIGFPPKAFSWRTHKTIRDKEGKIIDKIGTDRMID